MELVDPVEGAELQKFGKTTRYKDGRYEVELPWWHEKPELPDNDRIAKRRFKGLNRKLWTDVDVFFQQYNKVIEDYLQKGMAEESSTSDVRYYLSHHAAL